MATIIFFGVLFLSGVLADCDRNPALLVKVPTKELKALSGSCLQIPCSFKTSQQGNALDQSKPTYGIWIKSDPRIIYKHNIVSNSSGTLKTYPMIITGNMAQRNCTTMFPTLSTEYTNKYYLRVENGAFKATASCNPVQVNVQDSPWNPSLEVSGNQTEAEVVTITCSAITPCPRAPPQLTWDLHQGATSRLLANPDGTFTTKITQTIPLTTSHDQRRITCTAAYHLSGGVKAAYSTLTLNVTYGPKDTSVQVTPSGSLSAGESVTLSCSSRANPHIQDFTWFRHSSQGPVSVSKGDTFTFSFSENKHGQYYCEAKNRVGKQTSSVVHVGPGGVKVAGSSSQSIAIAGAVIGILLVLIVIFAIWRFKLRRKSAQPTQSHGDGYT